MEKNKALNKETIATLVNGEVVWTEAVVRLRDDADVKFTVRVKTSLPLADRLALVDEIVDAAFTDEGEYIMFSSDVMADMLITLEYTDISSDGELGLEEALAVVEKTNIMEVIQECTHYESRKVRDEAEGVIWDRHHKSKWDDLADVLIGLVSGIGEKFDGLDADKVKKLVDKLEHIDEKKLVDAVIDKSVRGRRAKDLSEKK